MNGIDSEIFGIWIDKAYKNHHLELDLLSISLQECFLQNIEHSVFFVNEDDQNQIDATLKVGFKQIDTYRCYKIKL